MGDELGWPVLRPLWRGWTWFGRAAVGLFAAGGLWQVVDVALEGSARPPWRWALIAVGAVLTLGASARVWVLAGRLRRTVWEFPDPFCPPPTATEYRAARTSLRTGAVLTDRQRRLVAFDLGQLELLTAYLVYFVAQLGYQILNWSAGTGPLTGLVPVACGFGLVAVGAGSVVLWRLRRLRHAAARIGAVPLRPDAQTR